MIWHILQGVLLILALILVGMMVFFKLTIGRRDSWKKPEETLFGAGERKALLLYQPSNAKSNVPLARAVAEALSRKGYQVTVNYPSEQVCYDPMDYDLLVFGSPVYMGETAKPLRQYIEGHPFTGKKVLAFVSGLAPEAPELEALKAMMDGENEVHAVKVSPKEPEKLVSAAEAIA